MLAKIDVGNEAPRNTESLSAVSLTQFILANVLYLLLLSWIFSQTRMILSDPSYFCWVYFHKLVWMKCSFLSCMQITIPFILCQLFSMTEGETKWYLIEYISFVELSFNYFFLLLFTIHCSFWCCSCVDFRQIQSNSVFQKFYSGLGSLDVQHWLMEISRCPLI